MVVVTEKLALGGREVAGGAGAGAGTMETLKAS